MNNYMKHRSKTLKGQATIEYALLISMIALVLVIIISATFDFKRFFNKSICEISRAIPINSNMSITAICPEGGIITVIDGKSYCSMHSKSYEDNTNEGNEEVPYL